MGAQVQCLLPQALLPGMTTSLALNSSSQDSLGTVPKQNKTSLCVIYLELSLLKFSWQMNKKPQQEETVQAGPKFLSSTRLQKSFWVLEPHLAVLRGHSQQYLGNDLVPELKSGSPASKVCFLLFECSL